MREGVVVILGTLYIPTYRIISDVILGITIGENHMMAIVVVVPIETVTTTVGMFRGSAPSPGPEEREPNVRLHRLREGCSALIYMQITSCSEASRALQAGALTYNTVLDKPSLVHASLCRTKLSR